MCEKSGSVLADPFALETNQMFSSVTSHLVGSQKASLSVYGMRDLVAFQVNSPFLEVTIGVKIEIVSFRLTN